MQFVLAETMEDVLQTALVKGEKDGQKRTKKTKKKKTKKKTIKQTKIKQQKENKNQKITNKYKKKK